MNIIRFIQVSILFAVSVSEDIEILGKSVDGTLENAIGTHDYGWIFDSGTSFVLRCQVVGIGGTDTLKWLKGGSEVGGDTQQTDGAKVYLEHQFAYSEAGTYTCKHSKDDAEQSTKSYTIYTAAISAEPASVQIVAGAGAALTCSFNSPDFAGDWLPTWVPTWEKPSNGEKWTTSDVVATPGKLVTKCNVLDARVTYAGNFLCSWALTTSDVWYTNNKTPSVTVNFSVLNLGLSHTPKYGILGGGSMTYTCTCTANTKSICDAVVMSPNPENSRTDWTVENTMTIIVSATVNEGETIICSDSSAENSYGLSASLTLPFLLSLSIGSDDYTTYYASIKEECHHLPGCKLSGFPDNYDFDGNTADLPKLVMDKDGKRMQGLQEIESQEVKDNMIQLLAGVDTTIAGEVRYKCDLDSPYTMNDPKLLSVKILGLEADLSELYIVPAGEKHDLTIELLAIMSRAATIVWNVDGVEETFEMTKEGSNYKSTKQFGTTDSPVFATVTYPSYIENNEMIKDGFIIKSATAIIKALIITAPYTEIPTGGTIVITCSIRATKKDEHVIGIYKGDTVLVSGEDVTVGDQEMEPFGTAILKTAVISNAKKSDGTSYKCGITIDGTVKASKTLDITIETFQAAATSEYWLEGTTKSARLMCHVEASSSSDYTIDWYKGDSTLTHNQDGFTILTETNSDSGASLLYSTLHKANVVESDAGTYQCRIGEAKQEITVQVVGVEVTKNKVYLSEDSSLSTGVVCSVKAPSGAKFSVLWKNKEGGTVTGSTASYSSPNIVNELVVASAEEGSAGEYACTVVHTDSKLGSAASGVTTPATVYILEPGADSVLYYNPGTSVTLTCSYTLTPPDDTVTVNYQFKDSASKELQSSDQDTYKLEMPDGDTTTTCVVTMETVSVTKSLLAKPRKIGVTEDGVRYVYAGSEAKITCHLTASDSEVADYAPMWLKGVTTIAATAYTVFALTAAEGDDLLESILTLPGTSEETSGNTFPGVYSCRVASLDTSTSTDLRVYTVIEPVGTSLVKFWSVTGDTVTLEYAVDKPPGDTKPKLVSHSGTPYAMICATERCTHSVTVTRKDEDQAVKPVGYTIKLTGSDALGAETSTGLIVVNIYTRELSGMKQKVFVTGETVNLSCEVVAEDTAEIGWTKDSEVLTDTAVVGDYNTVAKSRQSTLSVEVLNTEDLMKYACTFSTTKLALSHIKVSGPVSIGVDGESVEDKTLTVNEGVSLTITCSASVPDTDVVTTVTLMRGDKEAAGFTLAGSDRQDKKFTVAELSFSQKGDYKCSMTYVNSGSDATSLSDVLTVVVNEWETSTDYMDIVKGTNTSVSFSGDIDSKSGYWQDEATGVMYTASGPVKRSAGEMVVTEHGTTTTLTIPPGGLTSTTSFKVRATVGGKEEVKRKRVQVYESVVTAKVLFDKGTLHSSQGYIEIPISDYPGVPTVTTEPEANYHVTNANAERIQVLVWPKEIGEQVVITVTTVLNDQSTNVNTLTFSKVGIKTNPTISDEDERIVFYKSGMNDEEKAAAAISCTFEADKALGTYVHGSRIEEDGSVKKSGEVGEKTITLSQGDLSEPAKGDSDSYTCVFVVEYEETSREYSRLFTVQLKTSKTNAGAIAAAVIIAVLIIAIIVSFFVYRSRRNRGTSQVWMKTTSSPNQPVQETSLSGPENSHPKFNDAVSFLDKIQARFAGQPDIYQTFLNTLTDFRSKKIVKADLVRKVGILFEGHPDLIEGFGNFLSSKKRASADIQYTAIDLQGNSGGVEIYVNPVAEKRV